MFFSLAQSQGIKFKTAQKRYTIPQLLFHSIPSTLTLSPLEWHQLWLYEYISAVLKWQFLGSAIQTQCLSMAKAIVEDVNSTKNLHKGLWNMTVIDRRKTGVESVFIKMNWVINSVLFCQIDPFLGLCCFLLWLFLSTGEVKIQNKSKEPYRQLGIFAFLRGTNLCQG